MSDEIRVGASPGVRSDTTPARRLVPMRIGTATVYVEDVAEPSVIEQDDQVRPVAPPSPQEAFEAAGDFLRECVRIIGERVEALATAQRPHEVTVEFSLNFEVKGKATLIPVFLTGETGASTGLKVKAVWKRQE
jgi:hypothetical protein